MEENHLIESGLRGCSDISFLFNSTKEGAPAYCPQTVANPAVIATQCRSKSFGINRRFGGNQWMYRSRIIGSREPPCFAVELRRSSAGQCPKGKRERTSLWPGHADTVHLNSKGAKASRRQWGN